MVYGILRVEFRYVLLDKLQAFVGLEEGFFVQSGNVPKTVLAGRKFGCDRFQSAMARE